MATLTGYTPDASDKALQELLAPGTRVFCLTGAGVSTASGLGDYRDKQGQWKRTQPITGQTFRNDATARKRYWARSAIGWPAFSGARPGLAHKALRSLAQQERITSLVTQNVDELHQQAGHQKVIDLHGVLSTVSCLDCGHREQRNTFQTELLAANLWLSDLSKDASVAMAPDGDADVESAQIRSMIIPGCPACDGMMKPDVVFFGENVPRARVEDAMEQLRQCDVLLVAGSSLMVFSGFRFCRDAHQRSQPVVIINDGLTRADELAVLKVSGDCGQRLRVLADRNSESRTTS